MVRPFWAFAWLGAAAEEVVGVVMPVVAVELLELAVVAAGRVPMGATLPDCPFAFGGEFAAGDPLAPRFSNGLERSSAGVPTAPAAASLGAGASKARGEWPRPGWAGVAWRVTPFSSTKEPSGKVESP